MTQLVDTLPKAPEFLEVAPVLVSVFATSARSLGVTMMPQSAGQCIFKAWRLYLRRPRGVCNAPGLRHGMEIAGLELLAAWAAVHAPFRMSCQV